MTTVYVLINCNIGSEVWVIGELKKIDCVKEIQGIFGLFDVLVKVKTSEMKMLNQTILTKIQKIEHVQSVQTLIVT